MPTHRDTVPPPSPFRDGPYTSLPVPPATAQDPVQPSTAHTSTVRGVKILLLVLFVVLASNPSAAGWCAVVIAGILLTVLVVNWIAWMIRKASEL